jgi:hypothetical protein
MRKTDKKIDNQLRVLLTNVCEVALKKIEGFQWLTHIVDYANFPKSLTVICIFDTEDNLEDYLQSSDKKILVSLIESELSHMRISIKNMNKHISYDTEQGYENKQNKKRASNLH